MQALRDYLTNLSKREQILIGVMMGLLLVVVGYYGITRPLVGAIATVKQEQADAVLREGRIMAKIDHLTGQGTQLEKRTTVDGPLDLFVRGSLSELGVAPTEVTAAGDARITLTITPVAAPTLFGWIAAMEARGLVVSDMDVKPAEGSTLTARLTLDRS